jgi:CBS domain containing-hemolysin-like protein
MISLLILFFVLAISISFLCSLWEAVLLSITPSYAQIKLQEGSSLGIHLRDFKQNIDKPLAAILTLNTIAHTVGAIGVGNQAALLWSETNPIITSFVIPVVMTLAILVLSELIPKTLGANNWKPLAAFTVWSLNNLITLLYPLIWFSQGITGLLKKDHAESVLSRSDFVAMTELGAEEGVFEDHESDIITNLLKVDSVQAMDIMTPRTVVRMAAENLTLREYFTSQQGHKFSRIPIFENGNPDHITGFILKDELLEALVAGEDEKTLEQIRRDISVIPQQTPLRELFQQMLARSEHISLVIDQFGGMAGIITMEDVLETIIGAEIVDEMDNTDDMRLLARKNWEKRAQRLGLTELCPSPTEEESGSEQTTQ